MSENIINDQEVLSTGNAAKRLGIPRHRLAYAFEAGILPEPERLAGRRMIPASDLPRIALRLGLNPQVLLKHEE